MNSNMEEIISNPLNIIKIISFLNNSFFDIFIESSLHNLRKLKISEEEIGKIKVELEKFPEDPYGYYLGGHCVSFSDILCTIFDGYSVRYQSMDHVIVKIGNHFYDVRGIIDAFVTEDYKIVNDDKSMQEMYNRLAPLKKDEEEFFREQRLISLGKEMLDGFTLKRKID